MRASLSFLLAAAAAAAVAAAPSSSPLLHRRQNTKEYDILAAPDADVGALLEQLGLSAANKDGSVFVTFDNHRFRGFSGAITEAEVEALRAVEGVLSVREAARSVPAAKSRSDATWGLQRISQEGRVGVVGEVTGRGYTYAWNDTSTLGAGVDLYVIDSGIYLEHDEFGGRAVAGFNFYADAPGDVFGHGSHCAGSAAGETVGVAMNANIIDVKTIADDGLGSSSAFFAGLDWILGNHANRSTQPDFVASVVSMSISFSSVMDNVDTAVKELAAAGIHVSIAAGNTYDDACTHSPSSAGGPGTDLVVVGASTVNDTILWFSSTGPCVDVYAPGADVVSAAVTGPGDYLSDSGTSMAAPHVAGLLAYFIGDDEGALGVAPARAKERVVGLARERGDGVLSVNANFVEGGEVVLVGNGVV